MWVTSKGNPWYLKFNPSEKWGGNKMMSLENGKITAHRIVVNAVKRANLVWTHSQCEQWAVSRDLCCLQVTPRAHTNQVHSKCENLLLQWVTHRKLFIKHTHELWTHYHVTKVKTGTRVPKIFIDYPACSQLTCRPCRRVTRLKAKESLENKHVSGSYNMIRHYLLAKNTWISKERRKESISKAECLRAD